MLNKNKYVSSFSITVTLQVPRPAVGSRQENGMQCFIQFAYRVTMVSLSDVWWLH